MRLRPSRALGLALAVAFLAASATAEDPPVTPPSDRGAADVEVFEQAWRLVRDQFYDRNFKGLDWEAVRLRYLPRAKQAREARALHDVILAMLAELRASHVALVEADVFRDHYDNEAKGQLAWRHGLVLVEVKGSVHVAEVGHGTAAEAAGVLRGDRLVQIDGRMPEVELLRPAPWDAGLGGSRAWYLPIEATEPSRPVELRLERFEGRKGTFATRVAARPWSDTESTRASLRIVTKPGEVSVAYVRLYHLLSEEVVDILAGALAGPLAQAHALVIDLRGRGGLPSAVDRLTALFDGATPGGPRWDRPVVLATDRETRSAKELVAFRFRERKLGPIVGQRTRGAVLGARFHELRDKSQLLLPNFDLRAMTGGTVLEGAGVAPDVVVEDSLPYARGRDPIVERALEVAHELALRRRRAGRTHGWY